jgi:hypothetical protein
VAKVNDFTGRQKEALQKQFAEEQAQRATEMSLATAEAQIKLETEVIDATKPSVATVIVEDITKISTQDDTVVIRVVEDIENMTLGIGNNYSFKAGQKYQVTKAVATHLQEKGYLAGVI